MGKRHRLRGVICIAWASALASMFIPSGAGAAELTFPFSAHVPSDAVAGSDAGRLNGPRGIAVDPASHLIYVAEELNRRVSVFTPWGEFIKAFGWGVKNGAAELQTCTSATGCQAGLSGSQPGAFGAVLPGGFRGPTGIALDKSGAVYVMDLGNFRVQKFDPGAGKSAAKVTLTFGGKVNETTGGNVCTAASGDTCVGGQAGSSSGEFNVENINGVVGDYIEVNPSGSVVVADKDRIQTFSATGIFQSQFSLPESGNPGALAIDPVSGDIYFAYAQNTASGFPSPQPGVYRFSPAGVQTATKLPVGVPTALATDPSGDVFVVSVPLFQSPRILQFTSSGGELGEFGRAPNSQSGLLYFGLATGVVDSAQGIDVYSSQSLESVSGFHIYGAVPDPAVVGPPPTVPPTIIQQYAASVGSGDAVVRAAINPHFWTDDKYFVEYGTVACEVGPCSKQPTPPGSSLTSKPVNEAVTSAGVLLTGLQPLTTYHYRFVSTSGGGGPVVGPDRTFTTTALPAGPNLGCANQAFRLGAGAFLPDCRGYEMVSPVDKGGADAIPLSISNGLPAALNQAAIEGDKLTYSAYKAFGEAQSSPYSSQYLTVRDPEAGWVGRSISSPRSGPTLLETGGLDSQFKAFTPNLCGGWLMQDTALSLAVGSVPDYSNLYQQDLCGGAGYEPITRVKPAERTAKRYFFELQGYAADQSHIVFRANGKLTENAPAGDSATAQVYDYSGGKLRYVCLLPDGTPVTAGCSVGTGAGLSPGGERTGSVAHAVSANGLRIFWSASSNGTGKLYLRTNSTKTIAVSKGSARYWGASPTGSRAIFTEGENLYEFQAEKDAPETGTLIAEGVKGVVGMSEDAARVYFVSSKDLDVGGPAVAGQPNLYLHDGGGFSFVATLSSSDLVGISSIAPEAFRHVARVTPDGESVAFVSNAGLTGNDSLDVQSGEPDAQVYLYDAGAKALHCVSCNSTGARPMGRDVKSAQHLAFSYWASALIPASENQLYAPRALSDDGSHLFFNSYDALVPRDTNQALDVYEWEAQGAGDCEDAGGCVALISSGESPQASEFVDADPTGKNAFFTTNESLVTQDTGLIDIYDAREGGGFPPPPTPGPACEGEACQHPAPAPSDPTPSSAVVHSPGNPKPQKPKSCPKGKHKVKKKGKATCVKNAKKASKSGRAGR